MRRLTALCALGVSSILALSACNVGGQDNDGGGSGMDDNGDMGDGDEDADGDADAGDGDTTTDTGDGDGDGDTICGGIPVPGYVTEECILQIIGLVVNAQLGGDEDAFEDACTLLRAAIATEAVHSALGIPVPQQVTYLFFKALFIKRFSPMGDLDGAYEREVPGFGVPIDPFTINDEFPCGDGPNGFTVCGGGDFPDSDVIILAGATEDPIPLDQTDWTLEYAAVFDADGDTNNNYVADPNFPNDFFQETDQWYQLGYSGGNWNLTSSSAVDSNIMGRATNARAVIDGNAIMFLIPADEFTVDCPDWRMTAFAHKGDYGLNPPNEWSGRLEPPVDMGLNSCN